MPLAALWDVESDLRLLASLSGLKWAVMRAVPLEVTLTVWGEGLELQLVSLGKQRAHVFLCRQADPPKLGDRSG